MLLILFALCEERIGGENEVAIAQGLNTRVNEVFNFFVALPNEAER